MRIGMILMTRFPPDIRVEKEVGTLRSKHEVFLLCPRRKGQLADESCRGAQVCRVFTSATRSWNLWSLLATCRSKGWERSIAEFVRSRQIDVLHVHDLPLLGPALAAAKELNVPVVADLHENYPAMLAENKRIPFYRTTSLGGLISRLSVSVRRWEFFERITVPKADQVIVVIEEARDRLVALGVSAERIHVVGNYTSADEPAGNEPSRDKDTTGLRLIYAGGFDSTRDLRTVIQAVAQLPAQQFEKLEVVLLGGVGHSLRLLSDYASSSGVADRVSVRAWMPLKDVEGIIATADVGLVPHVKSPHTDATIPHKLFQYMWHQLPVIVSDCAPLARIVNESGCGLVYESGNAESLASCIAELYRNPNQARTMGVAGKRAVRAKYNWETAAQVLSNLYQGIK